MDDTDTQNEPRTEPQRPLAPNRAAAETEPGRCKACDDPAQPGSMFCQGHQDKLVQKHRKRWVTRTDVVLMFCLLALLVGYPRLAGPPRAQGSLSGGWADLGSQILAGAEYVGLAKRRSAERQLAQGESVSDPPPAATGSAPACQPAPNRHNSPALAALAQCGNGIREAGEECDGPALGGASCKSLGFSGDCGADDTCIRPGLACLRSCSFDYAGCTSENEAAWQRFVINGDGTATDRLTGLMWEQKCTELTCADQHNVFATLPWRAGATDWLNTLNEERFAGHDDWRLPSLEEMRTLLAVAPPCTTEPCAGAVWPRAQTAAAGYWTSTTFSIDKRRAWAVSFADGDVYTAEKGDTLHVRAVRRGS